MALSSSRVRLRELLEEENVVTKGQIRDALNTIEKRDGKIAETLIELGYLDAATLERFIVNQPGIASIDLSQYRIMDELVKLIPEEIVRKHQLFPIDKMGSLMTIGMAMPIDGETIEKIAEISQLRVKAVYCNPGHIAGAIERFFPKAADASAQNGAPAVAKPPAPSTLITIASLLRKIDELPSLPETVTKTREALDNPAIEMSEVETLIERDPLVSAKVLKLANSAAYSFSRQIDEVAMALRLLGLQETYNLVLASSVLSMAENAKGFDYKRFWHEAMFSGTAVVKIAKAANVRPTGAMSTAGLLHDIGRFAMVQASPIVYAKLDKSLTGMDLVAAEEEKLGLSHTEAGFAVADHWELPEEITTLIRYHHQPDRAENMRTEASVLAVATFLGEAHLGGIDLGTDDAFGEVRDALSFIKLSIADAQAVYQDIASTFEV